MNTQLHNEETYRWPEYIRSLGFFLGEYKRKYLFWFSVLFVIYFYFLIPPYIVGEVINTVSRTNSEAEQEIIMNWIILLASSSMLIAFIRLNGKRNLSCYGVYASYNVRTLGFQEIISRSLSWHEKENTGNKVAKIQSASSGYKESLWILYHEVLPLLSQMGGIIFVFFFIHFNLLLLSLVYIFFFFVTHFVFLKKLQSATIILNKLKEEASGTYYETVSNLNLVKNFTSDHLGTRVTNNEERVKLQEIVIANIVNLKWKLFQLINSFSLGVFLFFLIENYRNNYIEMGTIFPLFSYFNKLTDTLGSNVS